MEINKFVSSFLAAANSFSTTAFLAHWHPGAILNDPSVGQEFNGHTEIQQYFEDYFIGYNTQTRLIKTDIRNTNEVYIEVMFTGTFPQGKIGGSFNIILKDDKIHRAQAELI